MSEIAFAVTGISLFLDAFKLCEYFELEANKAIERTDDLEEWKKIKKLSKAKIDSAINAQNWVKKNKRMLYIRFIGKKAVILFESNINLLLNYNMENG